MLQISSDDMTPAELYNLAYMRIRPLLVTVPGIVLQEAPDRRQGLGRVSPLTLDRGAELGERVLDAAHVLGAHEGHDPFANEPDDRPGRGDAEDQEQCGDAGPEAESHDAKISRHRSDSGNR